MDFETPYVSNITFNYTLLYSLYVISGRVLYLSVSLSLRTRISTLWMCMFMIVWPCSKQFQYQNQYRALAYRVALLCYTIVCEQHMLFCTIKRFFVCIQTLLVLYMRYHILTYRPITDCRIYFLEMTLQQCCNCGVSSRKLVRNFLLQD